MKKYLMTGVAALALCAGFTNCSNNEDVYDPEIANNQVVLKYNAAFIQAFGEPAPNQEWGFGKVNSATRTFTRAISQYTLYKGSLTSSFKFPTDCDKSKFIAKVPEGIAKMPANGECKGGTYYIDASTTKVNMNTGAGVIYVEGEVDLSADNCFEVTQNTEIYLPENSKLKIGVNDAQKLKVIFYIAPTATLETAELLKMDNTSKVYNHGTIKAGSFEVNNTSFLYNVGTLETTRGIHVENSNASIVNDGTIKSGNATTKTGGEVVVAGSGHVQNNAEWTVYGSTIVNSNSASWINNGHWTTEYYKYTAGSENVINNCFLEVKEDFDINLSSAGGTTGFKIDAGGGVLTKNFNGGKKEDETASGPYRIMMGSKSVFKVTGTAALAASIVGTWQGGPKYGYGFFGPDDGDYAVFQATHIVKAGNAGDKKVMYGGKLYVSADDHFASELDAWNQVVTFGEGFTKENIFTEDANDEYSTGKPGIKIDETPCNPGFIGDVPVIPDLAIRVFVEDLSATESTDFDFNDVVFDAEYISDTKANIKVWAAGGTLPLQICSKDGSTYGGGFEVHAGFGVPVKCMVNTHAKSGIKSNGSSAKDNQPAYEMMITLPSNVAEILGIDPAEAKFDRNNFAYSVNKLIRVEVMKDRWYELAATKGTPSCKIAGPVGKNAADTELGIRWLLERKSLKDGYPLFVQYVGNGYPTNWWSQEVNALMYSKNHTPKGFTVACDEPDPHE